MSIKEFFLPRLSLRYLLRIFLIIVLAWLFFSKVLIPVKYVGGSMEPSFQDGGFSFFFKPRYTLVDLKRGDVVTIRFSGTGVVLLKRVVGLSGDIIEFEGGKLIRNGVLVEESYVHYPSDWHMAKRVVPPGKAYVVGDNRSMDIRLHKQGLTDTWRIMGGPIW